MNIVPPEVLGVFLGAVVLGAVHGLEPGHGWPVAASYALSRPNKWLSGLAASTILGVGHLVSSIAMVLLFFLAKGYFDLVQLDDPVSAFGIEFGGPIGIVAGLLLLVLGAREYRHWRGGGHGHGHRHGHAHAAGDDHGHEHADGNDNGHDHDGDDHGHEHADGDDNGHDHDGDSIAEVPERGLLGIAGFAFALGFVHEEEFEIIALCAGSSYCLELMLAYALAVLGALVGVTLLLLAGYARYEDRVEQFVPYLPLLSASVLVIMGLGFILGLF